MADVEFDGPIPGDYFYFMIWLGAVMLEPRAIIHSQPVWCKRSVPKLIGFQLWRGARDEIGRIDEFGHSSPDVARHLESVGLGGDAAPVQDGPMRIGDGGLAIERISFDTNRHRGAFDDQSWWRGRRQSVGGGRAVGRQRFDHNQPFSLGENVEGRESPAFRADELIEIGRSIERRGSKANRAFKHLALTKDCAEELGLRLEGTQLLEEIIRMEDRLLIELDDDVMGLERGGFRRAAGGHLQDCRAARTFRWEVGQRGW
jgi:hypothetical protein